MILVAPLFYDGYIYKRISEFIYNSTGELF